MTFTEVGHLPVVKEYAKRIKLVETIDGMVDTQMELSPGIPVLGMVLDTLSGRTPLYRLMEFFEEKDAELLIRTCDRLLKQDCKQLEQACKEAMATSFFCHADVNTAAEKLVYTANGTFHRMGKTPDEKAHSLYDDYKSHQYACHNHGPKPPTCKTLKDYQLQYLEAMGDC
ncbi:MAG: DUF4277 domain-containing protein [Proteobacteria bacterium]|nr:DUF4277 domain-containing protein [Pseudomonadota bacterium]